MVSFLKNLWVPIFVTVKKNSLENSVTSRPGVWLVVTLLTKVLVKNKMEHSGVYAPVVSGALTAVFLCVKITALLMVCAKNLTLKLHHVFAMLGTVAMIVPHLRMKKMSKP